jgi:hypothetical protein
VVLRALLVAMQEHWLPASGGPTFLPAAFGGEESRDFMKNAQLHVSRAGMIAWVKCSKIAA